MPSDAEFAVVAVAGEPASLHRAHHSRDGELRSVDLEHVHAGLKVDRLQHRQIGRDRFKSLRRCGDQASQRLQAGAGARQVRRARRQRAPGPMHGLAYEGAGALHGSSRDAGSCSRSCSSSHSQIGDFELKERVVGAAVGAPACLWEKGEHGS